MEVRGDAGYEEVDGKSLKLVTIKVGVNVMEKCYQVWVRRFRINRFLAVEDNSRW